MKTIINQMQMLFVVMMTSIVGKINSKTLLDENPLAEAIRQMALTGAQELQMGQSDLLSMVGINRVVSEPPKVITKQSRSSRTVDDSSYGTPEVQLKDGRMFGRTAKEAHLFFSIPYAKAPVGDRRFQAPDPVEPFIAPFNASYSDHRLCYQIREECDKNCTEDCQECNMTEDCLTLNVYVPRSVNLNDATDPPQEKLPVAIWIHGGFFFRGYNWNPDTDPRWLAEATNTIIVSINYRVGVFGFLAVEDENGKFTSNAGLKDQQAAMQWVQDNIEAFGGNKDLVTIVGESAGAQSVIFHLTSAVSKPLFQRAIVDSNFNAWYQTPSEAFDTVTQRTADALGCCTRFKCDYECLWTADPSDLSNVRNTVMLGGIRDLDAAQIAEPYRPLIDGEEWADQPLMLFQQGKWHTEKPVIIGTNFEEMSYVSAVLNEALPGGLGKRLFETINNLFVGPDSQTIIDYYESLAPKFDREFNYADLMAQEITEMFFSCPNRAFARFAAETSQNVYLYNNAFAFSTENCQMITDFHPVCNTSYHSSELPAVFMTSDNYNITFTEEESLIANMFSKYWGSHVTVGNPSPTQDVLMSLGDFTTWPAYTSGELKNIRFQYPQSVVETDYRKDPCDVWDTVSFYLNRNTTLPTSPPSTTLPESSSTTSPSYTTTTSEVDESSTTSTQEHTTQHLEDENTTAGTSTLRISFSTLVLFVLSLKMNML